MFVKGTGNCTHYRGEGVIEIDFHRSGFGPKYARSYDENMSKVWDDALEAIKDAYEKGHKAVLLTHGQSTSGIGKTTSRSMIRKLMRSKAATPYIDRKHCIEHESAFPAVLKERA
jgi:hypothetical protein